jgi:glycosyltransferase involved in cell wall biosynthesis
MKVALLTSDRERCGIARYSRDLHAALALLADVALVPIHPWPPEGERLERLRAADVVHLQHEYSFWGTAFPPPRAYYEGLERFQRPGRLVITAHTVADAETVVAAQGSGAKPLMKRLALGLRRELRREIEAGPFLPGDRVIVHNAAAAAALAKRLDRPGAVKFWPMPVPEWSAPASAWGPLAQRLELEGRRLVTIFGFVTPEKGYDLAIQALRFVREHHSRAVLVIAGGLPDEVKGDYLDHLREIERKVDLAPPAGDADSIRDYALDMLQQNLAQSTNRFRFTDYLSEPDARAILEHTEVALLPYHSGTGSYAIGAALAAGCSLLTSDLPAFAEPLPAVRFRPGDVEDLREKLDYLLAHEPLRAELSEQSRQYATENSWARAAERHVALYQELVMRAG